MQDDNRLDRIENKLDHVIEKISSIDATLAKQQVGIDEHIKRSNILEAQMVPIQSRMTELRGAINLIKIIAVLAAIGESVKLILK